MAWPRGAKVLYSPYTLRRHGTYNIFSNLQKRQTCQIHDDSCHVRSHCVHLSMFLGYASFHLPWVM